jgi:hypothetical protein
MAAATRPGRRKASPMRQRSGWLTFSAVILVIAGIMRIIDAIWAFRYSGPIPGGLRNALLGHGFITYGWVWLITGIILIAAGVLVLGPSSQPGAEASRWVGIVAASLGAISAIFLVPYFPVWALIYIALAALVIYGLAAHYGEEATA